MTSIVDASAVVAALVDAGPDGRWARAELDRTALVAPHLMPVEAADILRRAAQARDLSVDAAALAHADLVLLPIELYPYEPFADRVWQLREYLTAYDAWYVAIAEALAADLVTLDAGSRARPVCGAGSACLPAEMPRDRAGGCRPPSRGRGTRWIRTTRTIGPPARRDVTDDS